MSSSLVYGPVPSRRLGRSLGINNIPPKNCSYSCVYCQVGVTRDLVRERKSFYDPKELFRHVKDRVDNAGRRNEKIDYLSFVPDGEPCLDRRLGEEIELLRPLGIPVAVITNASLIDRRDVQNDLLKADWVCCKVDAVTQGVWDTVNRPHPSIDLDVILQGIFQFSRIYRGRLATETMLVRGINDSPDELHGIAGFLAGIKPAHVYISTLTRPPAKRVLPASEAGVTLARELFREKLDHVECITGYEGNVFVAIGAPEQDILDITAVHPMRKDAVIEMLGKAGQSVEIAKKLLNEEKLEEHEFHGKTFYKRRFVQRDRRMP